MKRIVQFDFEDGNPIFIEVEDTDEYGGIRRVSRGQEGIIKAEKSFLQGISFIKPAARAVLNAFREMNAPEEIALEFGLKFSAKAGAVLASVDSGATFRVSLKWNEKTASKY